MVTETAAIESKKWAMLYEAVRGMSNEEILSDMKDADQITDANVRKAIADVLHVMQEVLDEREYGMSFAGYGE